jgi:hypothetical protein
MLKRREALEKESCIASQLLKMRDAHGRPISPRLMQVGIQSSPATCKRAKFSPSCSKQGLLGWGSCWGGCFGNWCLPCAPATCSPSCSLQRLQGLGKALGGKRGGGPLVEIRCRFPGSRRGVKLGR